MLCQIVVWPHFKNFLSLCCFIIWCRSLENFTVTKILLSSFEETWVLNDIRHIGENDIQLHNHEKIQPVHSTLTSLYIFPLFNSKIWQDFPDKQIKIGQKTTEFDAKLKTFFLNDLSEKTNCNRLLCLACLAGRIG